MKEVSEIRRKNLLFLIEQYGSIAKLNIALGRKRKDGTLSQIKNGAIVSTTNLPRKMGIAVARDIESKLNYPLGWMDEEHPEIQPSPEKNLGKDITSKIKISSAVTSISKFPLYELDRRHDSGGYTPILAGEIELPRLILRNLNNPANDKKMAIYDFKDNPMGGGNYIPQGSLLVVDRDIKSYTQDGLYIIEINGKTFIRKITTSAKGGFLVSSSDNDKEYVEDLSRIRILGFSVLLLIIKTP